MSRRDDPLERCIRLLSKQTNPKVRIAAELVARDSKQIY